jgi:hypothetical protein
MRSSFFSCAGLLALAAHGVAAGKQYDVNVGKDGKLAFDPPNLADVKVGDIVTYHFFAKVNPRSKTEGTVANDEHRTTQWSRHLLTSRVSHWKGASTLASCPLHPIRQHLL